MKRTKRMKSFALAGALATMLALSGCGQQSAATGPPPAGPPEVAVVVVTPSPVTLSMELSGRTAPLRVAEVRPQVGGIIQQRLFVEGSDVEAGQVLYQIDPAVYRAEVAGAEAELARTEANVAPVRLKAERYGELVKINAVSQQDYDDAQAALKKAEAEIAAARADLERARIDVNYTGIKAPISGRIGRSAVTDGALVTAGQAAPLATIQQLDPIYVDVAQSTADLLRLKQNLAAGQIKSNGEARVNLLLEDGTPYPQSGALKFSEVTVDQSTGSVTLRALFPNPEMLLLPGMFVRALIPEGVQDEAILVPQRGVTRNPKGEAMVMVVGAGDKVEPRIIKVSRTVGDNWLVSKGLAAGDRVILEGIQKARPGTQVKAVPFGVAAAAGAADQQPAAAKK
ncbi:MAG: efflux transporter periplasmic adaptor subunit [Desulfobulbaceae bacterium DB1]|nr:MAG: efflux transporter periplasmic adaptor subunit [Desulfobulbaceae bacterium DB1]